MASAFLGAKEAALEALRALAERSVRAYTLGVPKPLPELERRVVGVLVEKVLSTPASYPLTLNSLCAGCNQKNNRDPELDLSEEVVRRTLATLQEAGLVVSVYAEGARAEKWKTIAREVYALPSEKAMAVFGELLLRGPQTKAELRARASRMRHEISAEDLDEIVREFEHREDPLVVNLGRAPGGRTDRYAHTLYAAEELEKLRAGTVAPARTATETRSPGGLEEALREIAALRDRVAALESAVAELRSSR